MLNGTSLFRKRVNVNFWVLCLFLVLSSVISLPTVIYIIFTFEKETTHLSDFIFRFALVQALYPALTAMLMLFVPRMLHCDTKNLIKTERVKPADFVLSVVIFLSVSTAASYMSSVLTEALVYAGIPIPDLSDLMPIPSGWLEILLYFIVLALLPALCEEIIYRGVLLGTLGFLNKRAAIFISTTAFALVHATIQQIPFAFVAGLLLAWFCVEFGSIIPCIIMHFANNLLSGVFSILFDRLPEDVIAPFSTAFDITIMLAGVVCAFFFLKRRAKTEREPYTPPVNGSDATRAFFSSPAFWVFFALMIGETILGIVLL